MEIGEYVAYISLALAVIFWLLTAKQSNDAKKVLDQVKTEIMTWQAQLNNAAIDIISARPEVIAKESAAQEARSMAEFTAELSKLIETIANQSGEDEQSDNQRKILGMLLEHHKNLVLGKQQLMNQAIAMQAGHVRPEAPTSTQESKP